MSAVDGRTARWEAHNAERRKELVSAALQAIRKHGPGVGMDDIAAEAGTSKPVFYRHFSDKAGLYQAIVDWVNKYIWEELEKDFTGTHDPAQLARSLANIYLSIVEDEPEIYQFIIDRPPSDSCGEHPVLGITTCIGNRVSDIMREWLRQQGLDEEPANIWGHGLVGFTWATADRWIITQLRRPREEVVEWISALFTPAFEAVKRPL